MEDISDVLFLLLRLGLGTNIPGREDLSILQGINELQWKRIRDVSVCQGIAAIVFDGIQCVKDNCEGVIAIQNENPSMWDDFIMDWKNELVEQAYENGNLQQMVVLYDFQSKCATAGIRMMLMKGLAMGTFYPNQKHRCPGDIDCYLFGDYERGNKIAETFAAVVNDDWYKHSQICYMGELIENHKFFVHTREGEEMKELNHILCKTLENVEFERLPGTQVLLPPPMFNALFLTYHALAHFLEEGLRLKQLLDWAMFLKKDQDRVNWEDFYQICQRFHLRRFADIVTDFAVHYLGVEVKNRNISTNSPYTKRVLSSTLNDNNYVFSTNKGKWCKRWLIVSNMFRHRWKYRLIYDRSILKQLYCFFIGYIFKNE